jgi:hypothetical protein
MPRNYHFAAQRHQCALFMVPFFPCPPAKPLKSSNLAHWPDVCSTPLGGHWCIARNTLLYSDLFIL